MTTTSASRQAVLNCGKEIRAEEKYHCNALASPSHYTISAIDAATTHTHAHTHLEAGHDNLLVNIIYNEGAQDGAGIDKSTLDLCKQLFSLGARGGAAENGEGARGRLVRTAS